MKKSVALLVLLGFCCSLYGAIVLPASRRLAGPLDSAESAFGDEFFNFPAFYRGRAVPGKTRLSGWIEFRFDEPVGKKVEFSVLFNGVGIDDGIAFPGGQTYRLVRNRAFNSELVDSRGTLDLETGAVEIEIHALFQNSVIASVDKNIRIPFGFPNDYPPVDLPIPLPFSDRPRVFREGKFSADSGGRITGFEFRGETIAPVTVFPKLGLFPPFAFGDQGRFYFANPTGCLPGFPPQNCPSDETNPDGILLPDSAFFHPHFELVTFELREIPGEIPDPPCQPSAVTHGAGLVAVGGRLYQLGGFDGSPVTNQVQIYNAAANRWERGAPMPLAVTASQSAVVGNRIYAVGGWIWSDAAPTGVVQVLDADIGRWTVASPAPIAVAQAGAGAVGNSIYVIGGWTSDAQGRLLLSQDVQIYDTVADTWRQGARAPLAVAGASLVAVGESLYQVGGRVAGDQVTNRVFIYNTRTNSWSSGPLMLRAVYDASAGFLAGRIYLVGGRLSLDGPTDDQRMQILELSQNAWRDGHEAPVSTTGSGAAILNRKFYVAGGRTMVGADTAPGGLSNVVQLYDPALGWTVCNSRPVFTSIDVLSAAAGTVAPIDLSPGARAVILGRNLANSTETAPFVRLEEGIFTADVTTRLNGVQVLVDRIPAPIFSVSPTRVEFQIPYSVVASSRNRRKVPLAYLKEGSAEQQPPLEIPVLAAAPGIYVHHYGEHREVTFLEGASAVARNSDGMLNHPSHPARPGETVAIQVTGLGLVSPTLENGEHGDGETPNETIFSPRVTIGGRAAQIVSSTLAPREVGIYELRVIVPLDSPRLNNVPVIVTVAGVQSNRAALSVR
ncbi:MAG: hypothetical protein HY315_10935 [Acidobacteria bacterium]|nr:hypothetical protein [Acidobacteriota bacterium]